MQAELRGSVPKLPFAYTQTLINRAWRSIRESNLWSFNLYESAWISPNIITVGSVTTTQGAPTITFDTVVAAPAILAGATLYSPITARQFRIGIGGIYNIIALDPSFAANGIATLDRIYADPGGAGQSYTIYQAYYVPPYQDHLTWLSVRNLQMFLDLGLDLTRSEVDARDPQRSWYQFPTEVVPFGADHRGAGTANASGTLNYPMYELWGQAITPFSYQCYGLRRGTDLVNPTDTLPPGIPEELVMYKAREFAYEWAEANKDMTPRATGPDFRFLVGLVREDYKKELIKYRKQDKEFTDNWFSSRGLLWGSRAFSYYNTIAGVAGPYAQG